MGKLSASLDRLRPFAITYLRVVLGTTMAWHGYRKVDDGIEGTEALFDALSIPSPGLAAWVVAVLELFGGIMIVIGFLTRLVSILFVVELLVAVFRYKYGEDIGMIGADQAGAELDWALIAGFAVLVAHGAGPWSADRAARFEESATAEPDVVPGASAD